MVALGEEGQGAHDLAPGIRQPVDEALLVGGDDVRGSSGRTLRVLVEHERDLGQRHTDPAQRREETGGADLRDGIPPVARQGVHVGRDEDALTVVEAQRAGGEATPTGDLPDRQEAVVDGQRARARRA